MCKQMAHFCATLYRLQDSYKQHNYTDRNVTTAQAAYIMLIHHSIEIYNSWLVAALLIKFYILPKMHNNKCNVLIWGPTIKCQHKGIVCLNINKRLLRALYSGDWCTLV